MNSAMKPVPAPVVRLLPRLALRRSLVALLAGTLLAVLALLLGGLLYLLYRWQLTGPLQRLLSDLERIDPDRPGTRQLQTPRGHEDDELGQWVERANRLLASVARHSARHREAAVLLTRVLESKGVAS